jgi:hypothetical protein
VYYTVRENDDMFGISLWYGISLEALQTANPTVNPLFMSVGTVLLIPVTPQAATPMPALQTSPTAQSLLSRVYEPVCYSDSTGGLTCFILVENDTKNNLENVGGTLTLKPSGNSNEIRVSGIMPVNILPAGSRLPIVTYIPGPIPDDFSVSFIVDVVFPVAKDDARYIDTSIKDVDFAYSSGKKIATITGEISLVDSRQLAQRVWILAVGYDGSGNVVGIRRWEAQKSLSPRDAQNFSFTLYSLGPTIETIELFAEAQP